MVRSSQSHSRERSSGSAKLAGQPNVELTKNAAVGLTANSCAAVNWPARNVVPSPKRCSTHRLNNRAAGSASIPLTGRSVPTRVERPVPLIRCRLMFARCELFGALPEVTITTDSGVRFWSFSTTDGQPQWHLVDRRHSAPRWFTVREGQLHLGDGSEPAA